MAILSPLIQANWNQWRESRRSLDTGYSWATGIIFSFLSWGCALWLGFWPSVTDKCRDIIEEKMIWGICFLRIWGEEKVDVGRDEPSRPYSDNYLITMRWASRLWNSLSGKARRWEGLITRAWTLQFEWRHMVFKLLYGRSVPKSHCFWWNVTVSEDWEIEAHFLSWNKSPLTNEECKCTQKINACQCVQEQNLSIISQFSYQCLFLQQTLENLSNK